MPDCVECCNILETTSTAVLFAGVMIGLRKEMPDGPQATTLGACLTLLGLVFLISFCQMYMKPNGDLMQSDLAVVLRGMSSALFTTDLFVKNEIFGNKWDYMPEVVAGVMCAMYIMQDNCDCDKCYMQIFMIMNMVAQEFVAAKISNQYISIAAGCLFMAFSLCHGGNGWLNVSPVIWFNFYAGIFAFIANGEPPVMK